MVAVDEHMGIDLRAQAQRPDLLEVEGTAELLQRGNDAVHPVIRILLDNATGFSPGRIHRGILVKHGSFRREQHRLHRRRSDINADDQIFSHQEPS